MHTKKIDVVLSSDLGEFQRPGDVEALVNAVRARIEEELPGFSVTVSAGHREYTYARATVLDRDGRHDISNDGVGIAVDAEETAERAVRDIFYEGTFWPKAEAK